MTVLRCQLGSQWGCNTRWNSALVGGFKCVLFSSLFGQDFQFDYYFSDGLKPPTSFVRDVSFPKNQRFGPLSVWTLFFRRVLQSASFVTRMILRVGEIWGRKKGCFCWSCSKMVIWKIVSHVFQLSRLSGQVFFFQVGSITFRMEDCPKMVNFQVSGSRNPYLSFGFK